MRRFIHPSLASLAIPLASAALLVLAPAPGRATQPGTLGEDGAKNIATFSVCAYDPSTGEVGVAVQSRFFAVGSVVPWCKAGVGAVATQAFGNPTYGPRGLALMEQGVPPSAFLTQLLALDGYADQRQIGMVMVAQPPIAVKPPSPDAEPETATEENMVVEERVPSVAADRNNSLETSKFKPENMPPNVRAAFDKEAAGETLTSDEQGDLDEYLLGFRRPEVSEFTTGPPNYPAGVKQFNIVYSGLGQGITYTGDKCLDWCGGHTGIAPDGVIYCVQGNILTGQDVADAMEAAMQQPAQLSQAEIDAYCAPYSEEQRAILSVALAVPDLPGRLLRALIAGESKGGDSRGMQSAALKVSQAGAGYGGYNDVKYDLRVDDAANPFIELARILNLARPIAMGNEAYNKLNNGDTDGAVALFAQIVAVNPDDANAHYNLACGYSRTGKLDEALAELAIAIGLDPKLATAAVGDTDLTPLHDRDEFKKLVPPAAEPAGADSK